MKYYFRLQQKNISIESMRAWTSDYMNDAGYIDQYMFDTIEEYERAISELREKYEGTICVTDTVSDARFGGAADAFDDDEAEVVVVTGTKAFDIYDGVRLYSNTLTEIARHTFREWKRMVASGEAYKYDV